MKKILVIMLALMLAVCSFAVAENVQRMVNVNMDELNDCIVRVGFAVEDMDETSIYAMIYDEVIYDIVDVNDLQVGDTIETADGEVTVETLDTTDGVEINGGQYEGGVTLYPEDESNCYVQMDYESAALVVVGQAQLTLADTVKISVYEMDEDMNPTGDGYETIEVAGNEFAGVMAQVAEKFYADEFSPYQTSVLIENGVVTELVIDYMP